MEINASLYTLKLFNLGSIIVSSKPSEWSYEARKILAELVENSGAFQKQLPKELNFNEVFKKLEANLTSQKFQQNTILVIDQGYSDNFYLILKGRAKTFKIFPKNHDQNPVIDGLDYSLNDSARISSHQISYFIKQENNYAIDFDSEIDQIDIRYLMKREDKSGNIRKGIFEGSDDKKIIKNFMRDVEDDFDFELSNFYMKYDGELRLGDFFGEEIIPDPNKNVLIKACENLTTLKLNKNIILEYIKEALDRYEKEQLVISTFFNRESEDAYAFLKMFDIKMFMGDEVIFKQRDKSDKFYFVVEGEVNLYRMAGPKIRGTSSMKNLFISTVNQFENFNTLISQLKPCSSFGEETIFEMPRRHFKAISGHTGATCLFLNLTQFNISNFPHSKLIMSLKEVSKNLRHWKQLFLSQNIQKFNMNYNASQFQNFVDPSIERKTLSFSVNAISRKEIKIPQENQPKKIVVIKKAMKKSQSTLDLTSKSNEVDITEPALVVETNKKKYEISQQLSCLTKYSSPFLSQEMKNNSISRLTFLSSTILSPNNSRKGTPSLMKIISDPNWIIVSPTQIKGPAAVPEGYSPKGRMQSKSETRTKIIKSRSGMKSGRQPIHNITAKLMASGQKLSPQFIDFIPLKS